METILLKNFEDRYHDEDWELPTECNEYFHIHHDGDYLNLYDLFRFGYLSDDDFKKGYVYLRQCIQEWLKEDEDVIHALSETKPSETVIQKINDSPWFNLCYRLKPEHFQHYMHGRNKASKMCVHCQRMGYTKYDETETKTIYVESFSRTL